VSFDRLRFTTAALADLQRLNDDEDPQLVAAALKVLAAVDRGDIQPKPLTFMAKTGDLTDCSRVYFGLSAGDDTHRVVLHHEPDGLTIEAIAADTRSDDIPYLLAGLRLGRLEGLRRVDALRMLARMRPPRQP
jgi:hypothetical protein